MEKTKIMVEFSISGDTFSPKLITQMLGITPDEQWSKGEKVKGRNYPRQHSCWSINTDYEVSMDVNDQLEKIREIFEPHIDVLKKIKKEFNLEYQFGIVPQIENNEIPSMYFNNYMLKFIHDIEAAIDIDLVEC